MQTQINWESFSVYNQDARGIRYKFEDLCRQLFTNENLSKKEEKYLHVNPNNAGLEADPIYDEKTKCWIGFQVKYFDNNVDYDQIKHSAEKIIEYYAGRVDAVYLFCNKPLTLSAKGYVDAAGILQTSGITLEPITDNAILDLVRKYPYLGLYYFGSYKNLRISSRREGVYSILISRRGQMHQSPRLEKSKDFLIILRLSGFILLCSGLHKLTPKCRKALKILTFFDFG